jgi:nitroimidazol reductase NimA-like FMN-containing flavoprotein (pyridoxamine 5'-phosphate oxidase superfamily)
MKQTPETMERQIEQLLHSEQLAVLSTVQDNQPYASLVAFAHSADLSEIVFCTPRTTRKFANLSSNNRVALLIENSRNQAADIYQAMAVTAIGRVKRSQVAVEGELRELYLKKHPHLEDFLRASTTAMVQIDVARYLMVHNFQNVYDYQVTP